MQVRRDAPPEPTAWVREFAPKGATCPTCTQWAKAYKRKMTERWCKVLVWLYHETKAGLLVSNYREVAPRWVLNSDAMPKLRYFGLNEMASRGTWALTERGREFVLGNEAVPTFVWVFNGHVVGESGDRKTIDQFTGENFELDQVINEIMKKEEEEKWQALKI